MIGNPTTTDGSATPAMATNCQKCGAENADEARFCRICGVQFGAEGFHEAPTRSFEQQQAQPSQAASQPVVSPFATFGGDGSAVLPPREPRAYVPPSVVMQPGAVMGYQPGTAIGAPVPTNPLQSGPIRKSRTGRVLGFLAALVAIVLACLIGLVAIVLHVNDDPSPAPPAASVGKQAAPSVPGAPRGVMAEWYYEDATIEEHVDGTFGGMKGGVLTMTTEDDIDQVAEFYRDKLAEAPEKMENRSSDGIVLKGPGVVIVIEPSEDQEGMTSITVALGDMGGIGGGAFTPGKVPQVPPVAPSGAVEPPAAPPAPAEPAASKAPGSAPAPPATPRAKP